MNETERELRLLDPARVKLRLDESGHLEGTIEGGEPLADLRARAAFPFTRPGEYIELRTAKDDSLGFIRRLDELDPDSRAAVAKAVQLQHFVPRVQRVLSIKDKHHLFTWHVVTDRGETTFITRGRRQNVEETSNDEYIVTDTEGSRYRIPRIPDLDAKSLVHLRKVL